MKNLQREVEALFLKNRRETEGHRYTVPAGLQYPYQWFWDSCFHAVVLSHYDEEMAKDELRSLVARQHKDGLIGHVTYWEEGYEVYPNTWEFGGTSAFIQPPILAYALWRVYEKTNDREYLKELYAPTKHFFQYLTQKRNVRESNLIGIINPDESGEDNSPRFDLEMNLPPQHHVSKNKEKRALLTEKYKDVTYDPWRMSTTFWVEDVSMNAFLVWNLRVLSDIARELGEEDDAYSFERAGDATSQAMRDLMLHDGVFCSLSGMEGERVYTKTAAMFSPLLGGLYSKKEAQTLVETHLHDANSFALPYGIPTTAKCDAAFDPIEPHWGEPWQHPHWRGPIWMSMHWLIRLGLLQYGFMKEAEDIKAKSIELVEKSGFREYYNPETGKGMGAQDFTWGGLVLDME